LEPNGLKYAMQMGVGLVISSVFFLQQDISEATGGLWVAITLIIVLDVNMGPSILKRFILSASLSSH